MTQNESERDKGISELQQWLDTLPEVIYVLNKAIRCQCEHQIIFDDFDSKYHQPKIDSICETLGVPKEHA